MANINTSMPQFGNMQNYGQSAQLNQPYQSFMGDIGTNAGGDAFGNLYNMANTGQAIGQPMSGGNSTFQPSWLQGMTGYTDPTSGMGVGGWGGMALGGISTLMNGYLGMKQYGMAKDQLSEAKRQFNENFEAQKKMTNTRLEDRQAARVSANPNAYESVDSYMKKNEV